MVEFVKDTALYHLSISALSIYCIISFTYTNLCKYCFLVLIFVLDFVGKTLLFNSVIFKSYSHLSNSCQK